MDMASAPTIRNEREARRIVETIMQRKLSNLEFEYNSLLGKDVYPLEIEGDYLHLDAHEIRNVGACAIIGVMRFEIAELPDMDEGTIESACHRQMGKFAMQTLMAPGRL